ncbi:MAG TPA: MFS transporter [Methylomirabilota bacterium]|nr:MFS transporter [Methylomirabilota bacterium]
MDAGSARWRALTLLSLAELLALSLWFSASAVLPALSREWGLGDAGRAGLTIAVQLGFIVGTLAAALTNLPDVLPPRALMMWGALAGAVANAALALWVTELAPALALRFVTGLCLAGTYPPAMKIAATWFREGRGLAIGLLVAALTVGSATPHLIRGLTDLPWRHALLAASVLAATAALVVTFVTEGPYRFPPARFDLRMAAAVLRERGPRLACLGYFGHMWELYAMWTWLGAFLAASLEARGAGLYAGLNASAATFVCVGLAGGFGAYAGGALADRWGRTTLTMAAMAASGLCALLIGWSFGGPPLLTLLLAIVWGVTVIADSAQFSTAVTELAPAAYVGTALTTQTCVGFALTMVSIWLVPSVVRLVGWRWAFALLAIGPALGVVAMARLRTLPEAVRMAGGRR